MSDKRHSLLERRKTLENKARRIEAKLGRFVGEIKAVDAALAEDEAEELQRQGQEKEEGPQA